MFRRVAVAGLAVAGMLSGAVALAGGAAVAAGTIGSADIRDNSITSRDIKNNTLQQSDIANNAVGSGEIRSKGVGSGDLNDDAVRARHIKNRSVQWEDLTDEAQQEILRIAMQHAGKDGKDGKDGAPGEPGKNGVSGYEVVGRTADAKDVDLPDGGDVEVSTKCPTGEVAIAGGVKTTGTATALASYPYDVSQVSAPNDDDPAGRWAANGWAVRVTGTGHVQPYVICAKLGETQ